MKFDNNFISHQKLHNERILNFCFTKTFYKGQIVSNITILRYKLAYSPNRFCPNLNTTRVDLNTYLILFLSSLPMQIYVASYWVDHLNANYRLDNSLFSSVICATSGKSFKNINKKKLWNFYLFSRAFKFNSFVRLFLLTDCLLSGVQKMCRKY